MCCLVDSIFPIKHCLKSCSFPIFSKVCFAQSCIHPLGSFPSTEVSTLLIAFIQAIGFIINLFVIMILRPLHPSFELTFYLCQYQRTNNLLFFHNYLLMLLTIIVITLSTLHLPHYLCELILEYQSLLP